MGSTGKRFPEILASAALLLAATTGAQQSRTTPVPDFPAVLYGAAYYHEYMPYDRLDKDVALMKSAGLNVVRMGESTWSPPFSDRHPPPGFVLAPPPPW